MPITATAAGAADLVRVAPGPETVVAHADLAAGARRHAGHDAAGRRQLPLPPGAAGRGAAHPAAARAAGPARGDRRRLARLRASPTCAPTARPGTGRRSAPGCAAATSSSRTSRRRSAPAASPGRPRTTTSSRRRRPSARWRGRAASTSSRSRTTTPSTTAARRSSAACAPSAATGHAHRPAAARRSTGALKPAIIERGGLRIAVLGFDGYPPFAFWATATRPGLAPGHRRRRSRAAVQAARDAGRRRGRLRPLGHRAADDAGREAAGAREGRARRRAPTSCSARTRTCCSRSSRTPSGRLVAYSLGNFVFNPGSVVATQDRGARDRPRPRRRRRPPPAARADRRLPAALALIRIASAQPLESRAMGARDDAERLLDASEPRRPPTAAAGHVRWPTPTRTSASTRTA